MRIGPGVFGPRAYGAALGPSPAPVAVLSTPGGPAVGPGVGIAVGLGVDRAVDLAVDLTAEFATGLAAGLTGTLRSWAWRLVRTVARDVVAVLRRGGPILVALLTGPRAVASSRPAAQPAMAGVRPRAVPTGPPASDGAPTPRIPAPRAPVPGETVPPAPMPAAPATAQGEVGPDARTTAEAAEAAGSLHELALPADPTAPARARTLLRDATQAWDLDDEAYQDAALVVTELVANAVDHARTPSTLTLELTDDALRVAVRDARPGTALRALPVDPTAARGRGLQMIEALAEEWGVTPDDDGKTVWAVLPRR